MSNFMVVHTSKTIGPDFNEAASVFEKNKDVNVHAFPHLKAFIIETSDATAAKVRKSLPGWRVSKYDPTAENVVAL
jgi:hypothetical protein